MATLDAGDAVVRSLAPRWWRRVKDKHRAERAALAALAAPPLLTSAELPAVIEGLQRLIAAHSRTDPQTTQEALTAARAATVPLVEAARDEGSSRLAIETFVGAAIANIVVSGSDAISEPAMLLERVEQLTGVPTLAVALRTVGDVSLLALPLKASLDACLALVNALAPVVKVSLWLSDPHDDPHLVDHPGCDDEDPAYERSLAKRALALEAVACNRGLGVSTVMCWRRPRAAIVWLPEAGLEAECRAIAERCAAILGPAFERDSLTEGNVARFAALRLTSERRLTRLGFDLHDGPLQDVALLAGELKRLRGRLAGSLGDDAEATEILAQMEDLTALVNFLDSDLRDLASTLDSPTILNRSFRDSLDTILRSFTARSAIEPDVDVTGNPDSVSDSQRLALLRIIQEALTNVREHSGASEVTIRIASHATHLEANIRDNGCGFDVEERLADAARRGRMGLLGMIERVRLLGGTCDIESRRLAGTTISLAIARWDPAATGLDAGAVRAA